MSKFTRNDVWVGALLLFLSSIFFYKIILHPDQMVSPAYDVSIYRVWKAFFVESIMQSHHIPLWNPFLFSGAPFAANSQVALFYPGNLLFLLSKVELMFGWTLFLDIFLIGLGTYLFAKTISLSRFSSLISAITMMFGGTIISRIIPGHSIILDGIVWFPLLFLCYEKFLQTNKLVYGFFSAFPLAMMLLSGNVQIAVFSLVSILFYYILRIIITFKKEKKKSDFIKLLAFPVVSISIAAGLSAIQLLPSSELAKFSIRGDGVSYIFATDFSFPLKQTLSFLLPYFFGGPFDNTFWGKGNYWEENGYLGIIPLFLVMIATIYKRNTYTLLFFFLMLFSFLFSLGDSGPLFQWFFYHMPFFNNFRVPSRFLYVYAFSVAMLAGIGAEQISNTISKKSLKKIIWCVFAIFIVLLISVGIIYIRTDLQWYEQVILKNSYAIGIDHATLYGFFIKDLIIFLSVVGFLFCILILKFFKIISGFIFKALLIFLVLGNLWIYAFNYYTTAKPNTIYPQQKEQEFIKKDKSLYRIFDMTGTIPDGTIQTLTGFDPLILSSYRNFLWLAGTHDNTKYEAFISLNKITNIQILKLLNVKYIISAKNLDLKDVERVFREKNNVYKIKNTLPRAYLVSSYVVISEREKILKELQNRNFDATQKVILDENPHVSVLNKRNNTSVKIIDYQSDRIALSTSIEHPGFLVLSEVYYPGWRAFDNGKEIKIYEANYLLRSVYLTKGEHTITFIYESQLYKIGQVVSLITLLLCVGYVIYFLKSKKMKTKTYDHLDEAHEEVPGNYYHEAIKINVLQRFWHTQRIKQIRKILENNLSEKILDVGCHGGKLTSEIQKELPKAQIDGIDISKQAIYFAKKKYKKIHFEVGRAEKLPYKANSFNLVTCFEVLEHVPNPEIVISEISRVLKKGGQTIILVPSENLLFQMIWYFWTHFGPGRVWHHTHVQKFDKQKLDELLQVKGFRIKERKQFILGMLLLIHAEKI
jgi:ubiquinone/menaquinone biosynthesis C-methylase UbiE